MRFLIEDIHQSLSEICGAHLEPQDWAPTPQRQLGDFAIPCFKLASKLGKKPAEVAQELAQKLKSRYPSAHSSIARVEAAGPYLNVRFDGARAFSWLEERLKNVSQYGSTGRGQGKSVVIDFSSPNVAKEIALHHLRSTAIGHALAKIARLHGFQVTRLNYLGDWGTPFGKYLVGLKLFGQESEIESGGLRYMLDIYVRFNQAAKENPDLDLQAKAAFQKMEAGDPESLRIWKLFRDISVREFKKLYARLGIDFDFYDGESLYRDRLEKTVQEVEKTVGARLSEGALIAELPGHKVPILLKKDDGASTYMVRDVAAAEDRFTRFRFDHSLYVVAVQQKLHFQQLFDLLAAMGKSWSGRCEHIAFGMLSFGAKTMKSREGNVIFLDDVLDEAQRRALEIIRQKNPDLPQAEKIAEQVGKAALLFADLSQHRTHDVKFDWDRALSFEGDTAPFIQYAHARCASLRVRCQEHLEKLRASPKVSGPAIFEHPAVQQLVGDLLFFELHAEKAWVQRDPSQVAASLLQIAKSLNQLYHHIRFLDETSLERLEKLLALTAATQSVLAHGLDLLGLEAPSQM